MDSIDLAERSIRTLGNAFVNISMRRIPGGAFGVSVESVDYCGEGEGETLGEAMESAFINANERLAAEKPEAHETESAQTHDLDTHRWEDEGGALAQD